MRLLESNPPKNKTFVKHTYACIKHIGVLSIAVFFKIDRKNASELAMFGVLLLILFLGGPMCLCRLSSCFQAAILRSKPFIPTPSSRSFIPKCNDLRSLRTNIFLPEVLTLDFGILKCCNIVDCDFLAQAFVMLNMLVLFGNFYMKSYKSPPATVPSWPFLSRTIHPIKQNNHQVYRVCGRQFQEYPRFGEPIEHLFYPGENHTPHSNDISTDFLETCFFWILVSIPSPPFR